MTEDEIRSLLKMFLRKDNLILDEIKIMDGNAIADVVEISKEEFNCFEIKSDKDSMTRVESQVAAYEKISDYVTFVVGRDFIEKNEEKLVKALPEWFGIWVANSKDEMEVIRRAKKNPTDNTKYVWNMLWRAEEKNFIRENKSFRGENVLDKFTKEQLKEHALDILYHREWKWFKRGLKFEEIV